MAGFCKSHNVHQVNKPYVVPANSIYSPHFEQNDNIKQTHFIQIAGI